MFPYIRLFVLASLVVLAVASASHAAAPGSVTTRTGQQTQPADVSG